MTRKKRVCVAAFVMCVMILNMMIPSMAVHAAQEQEVRISETFDPEFKPWTTREGNKDHFASESDSAHGNYAKLISSAQGSNSYYKKFNPVTEGVLELEYDFLADSSNNYKYICLTNENFDFTYAATYIGLKNSLRHLDAPRNKNVLVEKFTSNKWHHIKYRIDLDKKTYEVFYDGASAPILSQGFSNDNILIDRMFINLDANSGFISIDNIKLVGGKPLTKASAAAPVEVREHAVEPAEDKIATKTLVVPEGAAQLVFQDRFIYPDASDGILPIGKADFGNWTSMGAAPVVRLSNEKGLPYAAIENNTELSSYLGKRYANLLEMNVVEFDARFPTGTGDIRLMHSRLNDSEIAAAIRIIGSAMYVDNNGNVGIYDSLSTKKWYHFRFVINVDKQIWRVIINDEDGIVYQTPNGDSFPFRNMNVERVSAFSLQPGKMGRIDLANFKTYSAPLVEPMRYHHPTKLPTTIPGTSEKVITSEEILANDPQQPQPSSGECTLQDSGDMLILKNGLGSFTINKTTTKLTAMNYKGGKNLLTSVVDATEGYYSLVGTVNGNSVVAANSGEFRVISDTKDQIEISFLLSDASIQGFIFDLRYVLKRDVPGVYVYFIKKADNAFLDAGNTATVTESRYLVRTDRTMFPYWQVDDDRKGEFYPKDWPSETVSDATYRYPDGEIWGKYNNSKYTKDDRVTGVSNDKIGLWLIRGGNEAIGGGINKPELTIENGIIQYYLHSGHGGTPNFNIEKDWSKVYGPVLWYINEGENKESLWEDANKRAELEISSWPYKWISEPLYEANTRGTLKGKISITDGTSPKGGWAIVAAKDKNWQFEGNAYIYSAQIDEKGEFIVKNIHSGIRTLYIQVNGIIEEYRLDDIEIKPNQVTDVGLLTWTPKTNGETLWQIGTPDRTANEFRNTIEPMNWGYWIAYAKEFPNGVDFKIGESDEKTDWNWCHPAARTNGDYADFDAAYYIADNRIKYDIPKAMYPDVNNKSQYDSTTLLPWKIRFDSEKNYTGKATMTIAVCANRGGSLKVTVNDTLVWYMDKYELADGGIVRAYKYSLYQVVPIEFDASLLKQGENVIQISHTKADNNQLTAYDVIRLEVDENARLENNNDNGVSISVDSKPLPIKERIIVDNGATMLPLSKIFFENLGVISSYNAKDGTVIIKKDELEIKYTVNENVAYIGEETFEIQAVCRLIDEAVYIPLRFTCEKLGLKVDWIGETNTINVLLNWED